VTVVTNVPVVKENFAVLQCDSCDSCDKCSSCERKFCGDDGKMGESSIFSFYARKHEKGRKRETKALSLNKWLEAEPEESIPNQPISHLSLPFYTQDVNSSF
jgi:hypothetical protein